MYKIREAIHLSRLKLEHDQQGNKFHPLFIVADDLLKQTRYWFHVTGGYSPNTFSVSSTPLSEINNKRYRDEQEVRFDDKKQMIDFIKNTFKED